MTDIVERLYDTSKFETWEDLTGLIVEAAVEIERLRERLGPVGLEVVEIDGSGHYVNVKVKAEIVRLRDALRDCLIALEMTAPKDQWQKHWTLLP